MSSPVRISTLARRGGEIALIAVAMVALSAVFEAKAVEGGSWMVASTEGAVTIDGQAAGAPVSAIGPGAVIETGADGNVVLTRPGDSITVYANSKMSVPAADNGGEAGILQTLGKLLFRMESRESRDFKIETPYLAAAIKGTTFTVEVDDDDAVVEVEEGSVIVTANRSGQSAYVGPGERASVSGDSVNVSDDGDDDGDGIESDGGKSDGDRSGGGMSGGGKSGGDRSDDDRSDDDKSDDGSDGESDD